MKTILAICIITFPLLMWSQTKTLSASGGDQIESNFIVNGSWGQVFTNQVNQHYSFSEGFQQYEGLGATTVVYDKVLVQPNPTSGQIQISSESRIENVKIFNGNGLLVRSHDVDSDSMTVNLGDLPSGIYFVHTQSENKISTIQKIIKL